jgi:hypothetical protein
MCCRTTIHGSSEAEVVDVTARVAVVSSLEAEELDPGAQQPVPWHHGQGSGVSEGSSVGV